MIRGDTSQFSFKIKHGEEYVDGSQLSEVEVQFGVYGSAHSVRKLMSLNQVVWVSDHFVCYLQQEDTFKFQYGTIPVQVRVAKDGEVKGTIIKALDVKNALSSEVI